MPAMPRSRSFRFDRAVLEPEERRLLVDGEAVRIAPRMFDLLVLLVERAGQLVSKDEIFDRVWAGVVVEENNLQVQVSGLRKVLGPDAIESVARAGYRFRPAVQCADTEPIAPQSNLPRSLTSFVGQAEQLAQCTGLLRTSRLLTVTGVGGLGKTRLSLEAAGACAGSYADGVWFVDLAPISDPALVSQTVALVVGIADNAAGRVQEALERFMRNRSVLLVLDNCEHLLRGCAHMVARLLRECAQVTVLATSREPLHVQGEHVYPMPTLAFPPSDGALSLEDVAGYDAVRLFVERAKAVQPAFALTDGNARAVCEICARVDGIPLAIELAAARVRVLSPEVLAERLGDRFRLLKSADSTAPSRHQTLRATLDWSYGLLDEEEKRLLHRLSVFVGGWVLEAAEAIDGNDGVDVLDVHSQLVEKSLVVAERDGARYRLLETVREYAAEKLDDGEDADDIRARHLAFFVTFAELAQPHLPGPLEDEWHDRCNDERQNLLAAYGFALRTGRAESALRIVYDLRRWIGRGAFDVGTPVLHEALADPHVQSPTVHRARGLLAAAFLGYFKGSYPYARRSASEAVSIAHDLLLDAFLAEATDVRGMACLGMGDRELARRDFESAVMLARAAGDNVVLLEALNYVAEVHSIEGRLDQAVHAYRDVLALANEVGYVSMEVVSLLNLARVAMSGRDAGEAAGLVRAALGMRESTTARFMSTFLVIGAGIAAVTGERDAAARFWGASVRHFEETGQQLEPAEALAITPLIDAARGSPPDSNFVQQEAAGYAMRAEAAMESLTRWIQDA